MTTLEKIQTLLSEQLGISKDKITKDARVIEDLGADSLDVVELLMTMEDEFGITVEDEDAIKLKTIGDILVLIEKHTK